MSEPTTAFSFDGWADISFLGHKRYIGKVRTSEIGGTAIFVVDTPTAAGGFDQRIFAASALYSLQPLSEEIARALAGEINPSPVNPYELPNEWRTAIQDAEKTKRDRARAIAAESVTVTLSAEIAPLVVGELYAGEGEAWKVTAREAIEGAITAKGRTLDGDRPSYFYGERDDDVDERPF